MRPTLSGVTQVTAPFCLSIQKTISSALGPWHKQSLFSEIKSAHLTLISRMCYASSPVLSVFVGFFFLFFLLLIKSEKLFAGTE